MQIIWRAGKKQPAINTMTPEQARAGLEDAARTLQETVPERVNVRDDVIRSPSGNIPVTIYTPQGIKGKLPVTLFFHFGGFVIGSREICHGFCGNLASEANSLVVNVEYRLAPEHPFPAPVEDALAAYQWLAEHAGDWGGDTSRIAVAGDSAGGMLAAVVCQEAKRRGWPMPVAQVLIYPWLVPDSGLPSYQDFADAYPLTSVIMGWFRSHYFRSEEQFTDPWAAPLNEPNPEALPPASIITAGFDPLRDEAEVYADKLREAGVPVTYRCYVHLTHSFSMLGGVVPAARRASREIARDLWSALHDNGKA